MSLSTFSGHVRTLVSILASATGRSLVLLDEVAAGTDPEEGSALAQALVGRLVGQARLTVVTTHYGALKEWASSDPRVANAATGFDPETYAPLYRIELGRPGTSQALRIAERLGCRPERRHSFPFPRWAGPLFTYNEFVVVARKPAAAAGTALPAGAPRSSPPSSATGTAARCGRMRSAPCSPRRGRRSR